MKCIVAGSRTIFDYDLVKTIINKSKYKITTIVSGQAIGVDTLGEEYAKEYNIEPDPYPVTKEDWKKYGKSAGYKRNEVMGKIADCAIIIWDGKSPGSLHMRDIMKKLKKPYEFYQVKQINEKWEIIEEPSRTVDLLF